jgi:uncharacterized membrane protein YdjX (TVP38/TMEM64 family)
MIQEVFARLQAAHWMAGEFWLRDSLLFCFLLAASQVLLVPVTPFAVFAGFVLGFPRAVLLLFIAKLLSATLNFTLSRYAARAWVQRLASRSHLLSSLHETVGEGGFQEALLLRLCPVPFALLNYCCGLTGLSFATFLGSAAIGILSSTLIFCGMGASFHGSFLPLDGGAAGRTPWQTGLFLLSLLASLWLARDLSKKAMQKLRARQAPQSASEL